MPVTWLSKKAAGHLKNNLNLNSEDEEVMAYSIEMILHNVFTFTAICLFAWLLGCLPTALTATLVTSLLRAFSGGAHSSSPVHCTLISVIIAVLFGKISFIYGSQTPYTTNIFIVLIVYIVAFKVFLALAPVDSPRNSITSERQRKQLKIYSLATLSLILAVGLILITISREFYQYTIAASLGVSWQTFTLTPTGHKLIITIDTILNKIKGGENS